MTLLASARKPLRLWPGVALAIVLLVLRFVLPVVAPDAMPIAVIGGLVCGLAIVVWWMFLSRAPWPERLGAFGLMIVALLVTSRFIHKSIAAGSMAGSIPVVFLSLAIPALGLAFAAWAVATSRLPDGIRRATMAATILLACGGWALVRTGGFTGTLNNELHWRWTMTPEERLLAQTVDVPAALPTTPAAPVAVPAAPAVVPTTPAVVRTPAAPAVKRETAQPGVDWPGFRGPRRDGIVAGVRIATDWAQSPPVKLWSRPIGPGWSSFAVHGDLIYTQEQRGENEVVACYNATTGKPVWIHSDVARFWETAGGAGPRGTPTLSNGRVYTFGATGILNVLNAGNGAVVWSRNAASDTGATLPGWGFASSPLVLDDMVIVAASGRLVAYSLASGAQRWTVTTGGGSYSSPHLVTIGGVTQILLLSGVGATSVAPADGSVLWKNAWQGGTIVQPAVIADGDVLISISDSGGIGMRRLAVARGPGGWTVEERWTSVGLKPFFNDYVVHNGHAFGFDGSILACIDLNDGKRKWKGGRYGNGQLLLLPDQNLLLVLSEQGELALVGATPDKFTEFARVPAIEGKTWNHPVLTGDVVLVRNGEEMAAFRLARAGR